MAPKISADLPVLEFKTPKELGAWFKKNHATVNGFWLRFFKKASKVPTVNYAQALDEALCYGWIDSQVKKYDDQSYIQKFTPRRSKSLWSEINKGHITRLTKAGRMHRAGLEQVALAKADGRWERAYGSPKTMKVPADFLKALAKNKKAQDFFTTLNKSNRYAIAWRIQTAKKPETRIRRTKQIIAMLAKGEKLY